MPISEDEQLIAQNTLASSLREFIGQDIDFPLRFTDSKQIGTIPKSNAGERITDSIKLILSTRIGERPFNPEFGSRLPELVFEPNDARLQRLLVFYTGEALRRWEKRIEVLSIILLDSADVDRNEIGVHIEYKIHNSHIRGSYVYPFVLGGDDTANLYTGVEASRMFSVGQTGE